MTMTPFGLVSGCFGPTVPVVIGYGMSLQCLMFGRYSYSYDHRVSDVNQELCYDIFMSHN
jgi:hypothetical protein